MPTSSPVLHEDGNPVAATRFQRFFPPGGGLLRQSETARSGRNRREFEHRDAVGFRVGTDGTPAHPLVGPRLDKSAN
jgi:hypothetical protein